MGKPNPGRMNRFAIDVLDAAGREAEKEPIQPSPAVRLALAWLSFSGVAEGWQVERFWTCLTKPPGTHGMDPYCRTRDVQIYLNRWKIVAKGEWQR